MRSHLPIVFIKLFLMVIIIIGIDSCYSARPYHVVSQPMPENKTDSAATLAQVYFYPKQNQTPERMDRDRYQCYQGAVKQTGFDPNASSLPPKQRMAVIPAPAPGQEVAASTVIGAAIGAIPGEQQARISARKAHRLQVMQRRTRPVGDAVV